MTATRTAITPRPPRRARAAAAAAAAVAWGTAMPLCAQLIADTTICLGEEIALSPPEGFASYRWTDTRSGLVTAERTLTVAPGATTAYVLEARPPLGENLVYNPGFALGEVGFESDYASAADGEAGTYLVAERPWLLRGGIDTCRDGERVGAEYRLLANARPGARAVWRQRVEVSPGLDYVAALKLWPASERPVGARFRIDGAWVGSSVRVGRGACALGQLSADFRAPHGATSVELEVVVVETAPGAPIAIDAIYFGRKPPAVTDTATVRVVDPRADTVRIEGCPGVPAYLGDGTPVTADTVACRIASATQACGPVYVCERVRFLRAEDVVAEVVDPSCSGEATGAISLGFPGSGGRASAVWGGAPEISATARTGLVAGAYPFALRRDDGCLVEGEATLVDPPALRWDTFAAAAPCQRGAPARLAVRGGGGTGEALVSAYQGGIALDALEASAGAIEISLADENGCTLDTALVIAEGPELRVTGPAKPLPGVPAGFVATLDGVPVAGEWGLRRGGPRAETTPLPPPAGDTLFASLFEPAYVTVDVRHSGACTASAEWFAAVTPRDPGLFPTAFSPNGDGVNDVFSAVADGDVDRVLELVLYDRWGGAVGGGEVVWDGRGSGGDEAPRGVYTYVARVRMRDAGVVVVRGEVTLLR